MEKKIKSRRSKVKNPALKPQYNLKSRYELLTDFDYLDKLSKKDLAFMNKFLEETVNANFRHPGTKLYTRKEQRQEIYNENNARNRDVLTRSKACGKSLYFDDLTTEEELSDPEDKIIDNLDKEDSED